MSSKTKVSGPLKTYLNWPAAFSVMLIAMNIGVYFINIRAGVFVTFFVAAYVLLVAFLYHRNRTSLLNELITFATQYGQVQKSIVEEFAIPYALLDLDGNVIWLNREFERITGRDKKYHRSITNVLSEVALDHLPMEKGERKELSISYGTKSYRAQLQNVDISELLQNSRILEMEEITASSIIALYLFDETQLNEYIRKNEEEKLVSGLLYLDNFDEATENMEEVRGSLLAALIERKINKYFSRVDGVVKRLEKDKYFLVMRRCSMEQLIEQKFDLLEDIKNVNVGNEMAVTISIGLGGFMPIHWRRRRSMPALPLNLPWGGAAIRS